MYFIFTCIILLRHFKLMLIFVIISICSWRNTRWLAVSCQPKRSHRLRYTKCEFSPQTTLSPNHGSGTSCVNWTNSRRLPAKLFQLNKFTKNRQPKSRISVFGCVMIRVLVHTTCTVNIVIWPLVVQLHSAIAIWAPVIVLVLIPFKWVLHFT